MTGGKRYTYAALHPPAMHHGTFDTDTVNTVKTSQWDKFTAKTEFFKIYK